VRKANLDAWNRKLAALTVMHTMTEMQMMTEMTSHSQLKFKTLLQRKG
jgi:hypothetical protein